MEIFLGEPLAQAEELLLMAKAIVRTRQKAPNGPTVAVAKGKGRRGRPRRKGLPKPVEAPAEVS